MNIDVQDYKIIEFSNPIYIKPKKATFKLNGKEVFWEFSECFDCVSVFLYHRKKDSYLFVEQFRAALYYHQKCKNIKDGISIELCSGIIDKDKDIEEIAKEECIEELGVCPKKLEFIDNYFTGFGNGVSSQSLFYAEIDDEDFISAGGGVDDAEAINPVWVKRLEFDTFMKKHKKSPLIEFAHLWFLKNKL
ncbi:NUDIX hydrolase [Campylobacter canadensis]|uniref:NUDIX hydrolase n=1 Tax=Campylobacter canadensis TaxID=449520 RepID=A0ABS7WS06_9BACT|nr:NUDIX hydrolase [Campylobacter canadensis]MBZ7987117.1 NUDIX hydrolase [Campylobacter canadensis]MBZ7994731.1 NUDIX hydrolase [Campylobacter canadensis]MBZ7996227.1 NUDIX hydrolase [Campylobacter canadensis]MBZ7998153.1 NUDIX hydrolase [Campylobacter canadensis]MBZ7999957.1 NUDIX hydrolase [Campylobacter canadensis]